MHQQFSNNTLLQRLINSPGPIAFLSTGAWDDVSDRTGRARTQRYLLARSSSLLPSASVTGYPFVLC